MTFCEKVKESADFIQSRISRTPTIGIILGSGPEARWTSWRTRR